MIFIWTSDKPDRVRQALQSVLQNYKEVKVGVGNQLPNFTGMSKVVVIALGNENREKLSSQGVFKPKNKTLTALRKTVYQLPGTTIPVLFSYSPSIREIDYGKHVDLLTDVNLAFRVYLTGSPLPQLGDYQYVKDFSGTLARIKELHEKTKVPVRVSLDLETVGLDPYRLPSLHPTDASLNHPGAYIVTIQVSCEPCKSEIVAFHSRQAMVDWIETCRWQLTELLNSEIIWMVGANLKYDLHWLAVHAKVECTNFRFDTTLVGSLLDENRSNGLDVHAKVYTGLGGYSDAFDAKADKSRMDLELVKDPVGFGIYAGGDTDACLQVAMAEREQLLQDEELTRFYINILHPASRAFEMIERGGVLIDMDRFNELEATVNAEIDMLLAKAKPMIGGRLIAKHQDLSKRGGVNLTKASLLIDYFFSPAGLNLKPKMFTEGSDKPGAEQVPSTSMDHLKMFRDVPEAKPVIEALEAYGSATKVMSTYVVGFRKHIRSDGRFHPSYWLFAGNKDNDEGGAVSGRLSARDPAFQTIPKHSKWAILIRRCYIAPPGYFVLEKDFQQGELRVMACIANERVMIEAYLQGMDLHALTGGRIAGYDYADMMAMKDSDDPAKVEIYERLRQMAKPQNFGLLYGMMAEGFRDYAYYNYGILLTLEEAHNLRNTFFETYPALPVYHRNIKQFAHTHGYVRSPLGRIRHLPLIDSPNWGKKSTAERQAINSPTQATLTDMMIWSMALGHQRGYTKEAPYFGQVHDAGYSYIPQDNYLFYAKRQKELMENLPFETMGWNPQLTFPVDGKFGPSMGELQKVKF
jgi:DNA polymerase I-like protein with 3'-5' exonuclease and polymerase domains